MAAGDGTWEYVANLSAGSFVFAGGMRDLRTYKVAKSAGEMTAIYAGKNDVTGAVGLWPMGDAVGNVAANSVDGGIDIDWHATPTDFHTAEALQRN